jgi:hypothetical protein
MINSKIAVGVSPGADGAFGTSDDFLSGGGEIVKLVLVDGADATSHIEAGSFGRVSTAPYGTTQRPTRLKNPLTDTHFSTPAV